MATGALQDFPIEVQAKIKQAMMEGGRKQAEAVIAEFQAQNKAALKAQGVDVDSFVPVIGRDIDWRAVRGQVFRCLEFNGSGARIDANGIPRLLIPTMPYGLLRVESPILNQQTWLPIIHRLDYLLAVDAYEVPPYQAVLELLVTYQPRRTLFRFMEHFSHVLHFIVAPRNTLEKYYDNTEIDRVRYPDLESIFGELRYMYTSPEQRRTRTMKRT